jgi:hypothetical protein
MPTADGKEKRSPQQGAAGAAHGDRCDGTASCLLRPGYVPAPGAAECAAAAARSDALGPNGAASSADWREEDIFSLVAFLGSFVHGETHIARVDTLHTIHVVCTVKWSCRVR